jgi:hypothetical protein
MKTIKRLFYTTLLGVFFAIVAINIFSSVIIDDLRQYSKLHIDRNSMYDSAVICTQLYFMNPTDVNKLTCEKIMHKIDTINKKLDNYYLADIYLSTIK